MMQSNLMARGPVVTRLIRSFHSIIRPVDSVIAAETPVLVYEAKEHS